MSFLQILSYTILFSLVGAVGFYFDMKREQLKINIVVWLSRSSCRVTAELLEEMAQSRIVLQEIGGKFRYNQKETSRLLICMANAIRKKEGIIA